MRGVVSAPPWLVYSIIVLLLTGFLFYVLFPRSDCDRLAQLSAEEVKAAVECAAKYTDGMDPATGKACNAATVKLCQEDSFSIFGGPQFIRAYLGLMVPEYMIYYKQFPTDTIASGKLTFTESYPFERAYHGQRFYDLRPTLSQFKQFFKTRYLLQACTSDPGLCFDTRGKQDVIKVDIPPEIKDVKLFRLPTQVALTNPRFYLVAPCYAKVKFQQIRDIGGEKVILAVVDKKSTTGSNYCYTNEQAIAGLVSAYDAEMGCEVGLLFYDFFTGGSRKAAEESAYVGVRTTSREVAQTTAIVVAKEATERAVAGAGADAAGRAVVKNAGKEAVQITLEKATLKEIGSVGSEAILRDTARSAMEEVGSKLLLKDQAFIDGYIGTIVQDAIFDHEGKLIERMLFKDALQEVVERTVLTSGGKKLPEATRGEIIDKVVSKVIQQETKSIVGKTGINDITIVTLKDVGEEASVAATKQAGKDAFQETGIVLSTKADELSAPIAKDAVEANLDNTGAKAIENTVADIVPVTFEKSEVQAITQKAVQDVIEARVATQSGISNSNKAWAFAKAAAKRAWNMQGLPTADNIQQVMYMFGVLGVPCVDVDPCRGAFSCAETMLWPGLPFIELTPDRMKGDARSADTAAEVFYQCCNNFNYGAEKNPKALTCDDPTELVDLIKPELKLNKTDNVTLSMLAGYLGLPDEKIPGACGLAKGNNSKICQDAMEVREQKLPADRCWGSTGKEISQHTFDFDTLRTAANITGFVRLFTVGCDSHVTVEVGNETDKFVAVWKEDGKVSPDDTIFKVAGPLTFQYLRISEDSGCFLDSSAVVLDPVVDRITRAVAGVTYALQAQTYGYFIVPENYTSKASQLCTEVPSCGVVSRFDTESQSWLRYSYDPNAGVAGEDFQIAGGDRIGILPNENSHVIFSVGP